MHIVYCSPGKHNLVDTAWIIILVFPPGHVLNYMGVSNYIICLPRFRRLCDDPCGLMANEWNRHRCEHVWTLPNGLVATTKWWLDSHTFSHMITTNRVVCWLLIRVEVRPMTHAILPLGSVFGWFSPDWFYWNCPSLDSVMHIPVIYVSYFVHT